MAWGSREALAKARKLEKTPDSFMTETVSQRRFGTWLLLQRQKRRKSKDCSLCMQRGVNYRIFTGDAGGSSDRAEGVKWLGEKVGR